MEAFCREKGSETRYGARELHKCGLILSKYVLNKLKETQTLTAIIPTILYTTRSIEMGLEYLFFMASNYRDVQLLNIYSLFRLSLFQLEAKLILCECEYPATLKRDYKLSCNPTLISVYRFTTII